MLDRLATLNDRPLSERRLVKKLRPGLRREPSTTSPAVFDAALTALRGSSRAERARCPRQESNLRTRFRKPLLYPLSYGGRMPRLAGVSTAEFRKDFLHSGGGCWSV